MNNSFHKGFHHLSIYSSGLLQPNANSCPKIYPRHSNIEVFYYEIDVVIQFCWYSA